MTEPSVSDRSPAVYEALSRRCAELGIALWHCDAGGRVLAEPQQAGLAPTLRQWLSSAAVRQRIESLAGVFAESRTIGVELPALEAAPGQWVLPLEQRQGIRRAALFLAMVFTSDAPALPEGAVVYPAGEIPRLHRILRWFCEDLERSERDGRTIEQFSEKLGQAYEETHLLYRMARLINCVSDAAQSVQSIGQQLQEVLPFGWLAIRFSQHSRSVRELSGRTLIAGQPPCDPQQIRLLSDPLLQQQTEAGWKKLLRPGDSALADATGAEVLAEPITHDGQVIGLLLAGNKRGPDPELSSVEMQFLDATADFLGVFHENLARFAEQREMFFGTLRALTASIDAKDRRPLRTRRTAGIEAGVGDEPGPPARRAVSHRGNGA
jgi:GAF domain-containing protein